jgi:hypothetical protein
MNKVIFSEEEKSILDQAISEGIAYQKKQIKNAFLYIILGLILSGILLYWKNVYKTENIALSITILFTVMSFSIGIAYLLSQKRINRLKLDFKNGKKIIGREKVKSINFFNQTVTLANGIKVYGTNSINQKIKKGDFIKYSICPSNQLQFECEID